MAFSPFRYDCSAMSNLCLVLFNKTVNHNPDSKMFTNVREHRDDYLDLLRDFEVKKTGFSPDMDTKVTFKVSISMHDACQRVRDKDFR